MIDFIVENYYTGAALTYVFGILVYMRKDKLKKEIRLIPFFFANALLSVIWFLIVPLTLILSFKDAFTKSKV